MTTENLSILPFQSENTLQISHIDLRLQNASVLVVDDVQVNTKLLASQLKARGYKNILFASNGREAVEITQRARPDLVILDLMMPDMDGFDYCRMIRKDTSFDDMPIIVQTALDQMEYKLNAFNVGASDYLSKPVDGGELEARVRVHLTNKFLIHDLRKYNEQIQHEIQAARGMQDRLMPNEQHIKMCERVFDMKIASHFETSSLLGGDCWGTYPISDGKLAIYMYDFSGHGISSAMNIFRMHTIMREHRHVGGDPGTFLTTLNRHLKPLLERQEFATMFYGVLDTVLNCLTYATAAPTSPLVYDSKNSEMMWLTSRGFPLGVVENATFETKYMPMFPGDFLLLFSDGLSETRNQEGCFLYDALIEKAVQAVIDAPKSHVASEIIDALCTLQSSHGDGPLFDDLTLNVYARNP